MSIQEITSGHLLTDDGLTPVLVSDELTVSEAHKCLRMSERHLNYLLDEGKIAFRMNGKERMVLRDGLFQFKREYDLTNAFLNELLEMSQENDD